MRAAEKTMKARDILYSVWQWTYGFPQSFAGLFVFLFCRIQKCGSVYEGGVVRTEWKREGGVSLGFFFFYEEGGSLISHEYGHTVQSAILGPVYPLAVCVPSFIWCGLPYFRRLRMKRKIRYSALYCEKWADSLGKKHYGRRKLYEQSKD